VDPWQYCIDIVFIFILLLIDGGRGHRYHTSLITWISLVKTTKNEILQWEAYCAGLVNQMFTPEYIPYQQATAHIHALEEYLRELQGDD
jgi:hypothetical protein